jgi:CheY-like chemotaxis protein
VVSDRTANREVLMHLLREIPDLHSAESGESALASIRAANAAGAPFELVLFDLVSGSLPADETGSEIRALSPALRPSVLILGTAYTPTAVKYENHAQRTGAFLLKPLARPLFWSTIQQLLLQRRKNADNIPAVEQAETTRNDTAPTKTVALRREEKTPVPPVSPLSPVPGRQDILRDMESLESLLSNADAEACNVFAKLSGTLCRLDPELHGKMHFAVQAFDFDTALQLLHTFCAKLA